MKFDPYAFAKEHGLEQAPRATRATRATQPHENAPRVAQVARVARAEPSKTEITHPAEVTPFPTPEPPQPSRPAPSRPEPETFPFGVGVAGSPKTWTGRIVSLEEWRRLSDWDKHGSTGKVWNGLTRQWEPDGGAM